MSSATYTHINGIFAGAEMLAKITARESIGAIRSDCTMQANLFGYGRGVLTKACSYASEGTPLHEFLFNIYSVRKGKVFAITLYVMTHMSLLSDRQITLYRIHIQKGLCKSNCYI